MRKLTVEQFVDEIKDLSTDYLFVEDNKVVLVPDEPISLTFLGDVEVEGLTLTIGGGRVTTEVELPEHFKCRCLSVTTELLTLPKHLQVKDLLVSCMELLNWPMGLTELDNLRLNAFTLCELPESLTVKGRASLSGGIDAAPKGLKAGRIYLNGSPYITQRNPELTNNTGVEVHIEEINKGILK